VTDYRPFRKNKSYSLAGLIILLALFLSFSAYRDLFGVRPAINTVIYPFQLIARNSWTSMVNFPSGILNLGNLAKENAELKEKLSASQAKVALLENLPSENESLRKTIAFSQSGKYGKKLLPAAVIGGSDTGWFSILQIDKGSSQGVRVGAPVVVEEGLVGRVVEVSSFSAKILLITDPASEVAAVDQTSRDQGVVEGNTSSNLIMKYVSKDGQIEVGDKILTSSLSNIFPAGIMLGTVVSATKKEYDLFYQIQVKPSVPFSKLETVFLVL